MVTICLGLQKYSKRNKTWRYSRRTKKSRYRKCSTTTQSWAWFKSSRKFLMRKNRSNATTTHISVSAVVRWLASAHCKTWLSRALNSKNHKRRKQKQTHSHLRQPKKYWSLLLSETTTGRKSVVSLTNKKWKSKNRNKNRIWPRTHTQLCVKGQSPFLDRMGKKMFLLLRRFIRLQNLYRSASLSFRKSVSRSWRRRNSRVLPSNPCSAPARDFKSLKCDSTSKSNRRVMLRNTSKKLGSSQSLFSHVRSTTLSWARASKVHTASGSQHRRWLTDRRATAARDGTLTTIRKIRVWSETWILQTQSPTQATPRR